jgi:GT2 family glycosyltransferase
VSDLPLVTINILAHNRRAEVARSLRAMHDELVYPRDRLEFIVVDNASTDGTAEMLRRDFPDVRVIQNENVGAAGWTRGFQAGAGDYFLVLDDDCYISGDALVRAARAAEAQDADLVSFRVVSSQDPDFEFTSQYRVGLLSFWACAALISRQAIEQLKGFDPQIFIWANELEFTIRLLDRGFRHLYLPEVTAIHMKPPEQNLEVWVYAIHMRHVAYVVAKLLRPRDAAVVLANLTVKLILGLLRTPSRWRIVPALAVGAARGMRHREPVRKPVSHFYRRNFREFTSPFFYVGRPVALCRGIRRWGGLRPYLKSRHDDYYASRPDLYPTRTASLAI